METIIAGISLFLSGVALGINIALLIHIRRRK